MFSLFKKEIRSFFSSSIAYIVLLVFFIVNALVLFVLPTENNIFDNGFATLDSFFSWVPFIFLFLIPAISMRSFAEEKKAGTLDILFTRPLSYFSIVMSKYLASCTLVFIALIPTFCYLYTVINLSIPIGNVDMGAFWGAFLGLILLGSAFVSISLFISSISDNQIIAFVLSSLSCVIIYIGFELISTHLFYSNESVIVSLLGIKSHYESISRGVIDIRDVIYYLSLIALFLSFTIAFLNFSKVKKLKISLIALLLCIIINIIFSFFPLRVDLTSDKRYTLMPISKEILKEVDQPIFVEVYLSGELPSGFKRLERSIKETLEEFRVYVPKLRYKFTDIYSLGSEKQVNAAMSELIDKGFSPTQLEVKTKAGFVRRLIFPVAELRVGDKSVPITFLSEQLGRKAEEVLNNSVENVELKLINAIRSIFSSNDQRVCFLRGQGELSQLETYSFGKDLSTYYNVSRQELTHDINSLFEVDSIGQILGLRYDLLILAQPKNSFDDIEKYILDQYIMRGGRVLWLIDQSDAALDTLRKYDQATTLAIDHNLDDMFFRYGFRINENIVLDLNSCLSPVITSYMGERPVIEYLPNVYCPMIIPEISLQDAVAKQLILENIKPLKTEFISSIDTIKSKSVKIPLLYTSNYSHVLKLPALIGSDIMHSRLKTQDFKADEKCVAMLLEGEFNSAFRQLLPKWDGINYLKHQKQCSDNKMIVISDGGMIKNDFSIRDNIMYPLGFDRYTMQMYDNHNFLLNCVHYLLDEHKLMDLKPRKVEMRLLDKAKLEKERQKYEVLNFAIPIGFTLLICLVFILYRRRAYIKRSSKN